MRLSTIKEEAARHGIELPKDPQEFLRKYRFSYTKPCANLDDLLAVIDGPQRIFRFNPPPHTHTQGGSVAIRFP